MTDSWLIRDAKATDIAYIYVAWLECYRRNSAIGKECTTDVFFKNYRTVIDSILQSHDTATQVACLKEDQNVILGFLVSSPVKKIAHFCFVKEPFRELGIANSLFSSVLNLNLAVSKEIICTHKTRDSEKIFREKKNLIYNPFILYKKGD